MTTEGFTAVGVTFDASGSKDFDGQVVSYAWSDDQGNSGSGPRVTFYYDPCEINTVEVTLTVTDNDGRTDSITKRVRVRSGLDVRCPKTPGEGGGDEDDWEDPPDPDEGEEDGDDSEEGGGITVDTVVICAAGQHIIATPDSGDTWNVLAAGSVDPPAVGTFRAVDVHFDITKGTIGALLGTSQGEFVWTGDAARSAKNLGFVGGNSAVTAIKADPTVYNRWWAATEDGRLFVYVSDPGVWVTVADFETPVQRIQIGPAGEIILFAGDADHPMETVMRGDSGATAFWSIVEGDLVEEAINGNGAVDGRLYRDGTVVVVLGDGAEFEVWMSQEALYGAAEWEPSDTGGYEPTAFGGAFMPDFGDGILASGTDSVVLVNEDGTLTEDSVNEFAAEFGSINRIIPEAGIKDVFLAAADNAILKTTNAGVTWGAVFPSKTLEGSQGWPSGAKGYDIAIGYQFGREPLGDVMIYLTDGSAHGTAELGFADKWLPLMTGLDGDLDNSGPMIGMTSRLIAFRAVEDPTPSYYLSGEYAGRMELSTDGGVSWSSVVPPVFTIGGDNWTFETFYWSLFLPGEDQGIYAAWAANERNEFIGDLAVIAFSEDDGASWLRAHDANGFVGKPTNIDLLAETGQHLLVNTQSAHEASDGDTWLSYGHLILDLDSGLFTDQFFPHSVEVYDYAAMSVWGDDRRVITIGEFTVNFDGDSGTFCEIRYTDVDRNYEFEGSPINWVTTFEGGDSLGRPINIIRAADTPILFALFRSGGPYRSTDNGETWERMPNAQGFEGGIAMDYDHNDDMLWVGRTNGEVYAWPCATTIKSSLAIPTDATYNIDEISAYTEPGIGYNGVVARHNRRLV